VRGRIVSCKNKHYSDEFNYYRMALEIDEELNDEGGIARDYYNMGLALEALSENVEAIDSVNRGLNILLELEKETGYHHPWIETLERFIGK
jgi:hypothetical protein